MLFELACWGFGVLLCLNVDVVVLVDWPFDGEMHDGRLTWDLGRA